MRIFIDPGHGGADPGVVHQPVVEKDLNLTVAQLVRARLENAGHDVAMARDTDVALKLSERGALSAKFQADLVISIHTNANQSPDPKGLMTFYWPGNEKGQRVAESIAAACPEPLRRRQMAYAATKEGWPRVRNVLT
ncbi:MAG TPA: N-acetylmuramoyl-L-alanine amidase, partial [Vicinamibacterales bacterium]|nr:N-acetylmuramoyl-L-alanine amidase [Vicinamibacterales bacterium]